MPSRQSTVAILDWSHIYDDFLSSLHMNLDVFRRELTGGWLFGYVEALATANVKSVFVLTTAEVRTPQRFVHEPTGTQIAALPSPWRYRAARKIIVNPYAFVLDEALSFRIPPMLRLPLLGLKELTPYLATPVLALARELRRHQVDAIICQEYENPRFDLVTALGALLRIPVFASFQGGNWQNSCIEKPIRTRSLANSAGLIIGTGSEIERVRATYGYPQERIAQIFNPLDLDNWEPGSRDEAKKALGIPPESPTAVWHGRVFLKRKGLDVLAKSWPLVLKSMPDREPWLVLIGTGDDARILRAQFNELGVKRLIWVEEYVRDKELIRRYLLSGDVYVFPSRHEGFPVAPIEAMALGLPVVAARAPGVADIFAKGEEHGGLLVDIGDPRGLADSLIQVLRDPNFAQLLGNRARTRALNAFDLHMVGRRLAGFVLPGDKTAG